MLGLKQPVPKGIFYQTYVYMSFACTFINLSHTYINIYNSS